MARVALLIINLVDCGSKVTCNPANTAQPAIKKIAPTIHPMFPLLKTFSWQELRHHPWRSMAAVIAVMLGVALAFAVHLINASALDAFSSAVRSVNGQPDLELRAAQGGFDEAFYGVVARHPDVALASPVLELGTLAANSKGERKPLRVLGVDALVVAGVAPALMPQPSQDTAPNDSNRFALFAPATVFLNATARQLLGNPADGSVMFLQVGLQLRPVTIAGSVAAGGGPLAVMDIAALQDLFDRGGKGGGQLSRIDLRLKPGAAKSSFIASLQQSNTLPANVVVAEPGDAAQRISNLSRAYRTNLTVLALVALFTGAFLVFSVLSLSVARRAQQFALLGVLGLNAQQRLQLVLAESLLLGLLGSAAGIASGTALAALALRLLGGDLGGGYFDVAGTTPALQWSAVAALLYGALGVAAALVGGWWPARAVAQLPLAQTLKGLGAGNAQGAKSWLGLALLLAGVGMALLPPVGGLPIAAYVSVGLLLIGGITALPGLIALLYDRLAPLVAHRLLPLLAVERARRVRASAAVAVSGVVAALSLSVALTVMVASFRDSVTQWLDVVLPAQLYARAGGANGGADTLTLSPGFAQAARQVPGVARASAQRYTNVLLEPTRPAVTLIARPMDDPAKTLPLVGTLLPVPPGQVAVYISEAMVDLYGLKPGDAFPALSKALFAQNKPSALVNTAQAATFFIAGVWRDYARQTGSISISQRDYERLTGDVRINDLALWLKPDADTAAVQQALRALAEKEVGINAGSLIEFASSAEIRAISLKIFDRSFAVTYWLQAVAIAIGLFGVAASFSAQVLARRKEFGLLAHLGLTRGQILTVVAGEGAAWTAMGAVAGLLLGLAVSVVLVHVVNPQSFHWTMDMALPWSRLLALCAAVVVAGTVTAWLAGRAAAGRDAVLAVKEDW